MKVYTIAVLYCLFTKCCGTTATDSSNSEDNNNKIATSYETNLEPAEPEAGSTRYELPHDATDLNSTDDESNRRFLLFVQEYNHNHKLVSRDVQPVYQPLVGYEEQPDYQEQAGYEQPALQSQRFYRPQPSYQQQSRYQTQPSYQQQSRYQPQPVFTTWTYPKSYVLGNYVTGPIEIQDKYQHSFDIHQAPYYPEPVITDVFFTKPGPKVVPGATVRPSTTTVRNFIPKPVVNGYSQLPSITSVLPTRTSPKIPLLVDLNSKLGIILAERTNRYLNAMVIQRIIAEFLQFYNKDKSQSSVFDKWIQLGMKHTMQELESYISTVNAKRYRGEQYILMKAYGTIRKDLRTEFRKFLNTYRYMKPEDFQSENDWLTKYREYLESRDNPWILYHLAFYSVKRDMNMTEIFKLLEPSIVKYLESKKNTPELIKYN